MLLARRAVAPPAWNAVALVTTRRTAHASYSSSSLPAPAPFAAAPPPSPLIATSPNSGVLTPPLLHFNLKSLPPQLQREFDVEANQRALRHLRRNAPPGDTSSNSSAASAASSEVHVSAATVHKVMWRCAGCNARWSARPSDRVNPQTADAHRCPRCYGDAVRPPSASSSTHLSSRQQPTDATPVCPSSLLCEAHPPLAAQWDAQRNQLLQNNVLQGVTEVHTSASTRVWWRCPLCRTPWLESVASRVTRYELALQSLRTSASATLAALVCPACERRGVSRGAASVSSGPAAASTGPRRFLRDDRLLLSEALLRPSQDPAEISLTSEAMLQWRCRTCQFEYGATVANRFLRHERCPQCTGKEKSMMNLLVIQRPDVVAEVSRHVSRTRLRHLTVHDDTELPFVCRTCFSPYRMTARARCAVPRGVPACSKCFLTGTQVLAEAHQQMRQKGAQHLTARARRRVQQKTLQLSRSNRSADRLAATANELRHRDGALKD
ncbi:hypothetical protein ABB37_01985 [Leptomonas pyrrhocoris]|uniref:Treble clef zinc finger domain-containing protein n=1 Tax=Leptomonas pyrrhocoris TaxID=157538 RepID=A0A0M9G772_LEPPY|nr:hypothetical protein ABB37_01985 [Leptomonas pyrrhocoris]XP_015662186.1 hypothetical protein ABB37_01985 [Leptomonas pyrrhocoris]KPA83746.1 hypothetical protein ABB37_01985 [Leptomonas pyrrhocoris]KPA83747.1 hypothetical protein ABB37_01985 [Leptomonas pyrrhocoris]|eukprot:XP_015662185.1 hypothetical protein ABB37_01985 [Leptomonas pyrrhocoris]